MTVQGSGPGWRLPLLAAVLFAPILLSTFFCIPLSFLAVLQPEPDPALQTSSSLGNFEAIEPVVPQSMAPPAPPLLETDSFAYHLSLAASKSPIPKLVYICLVNNGFRHFALNLWRSAQLTKPPLRNILFYALDSNVSAYLAHHGAPVYFARQSNVTANISSEASKFRTRDYARIVGSKAKVAHQGVSLGYDVFILDADVALLRNPSNYIIDIPKCDLTVSLDKATHDVGIPGEQRYGGQNFEAGYVQVKINTGVIMWRSTPTAIETLANFLKDKYRTRYPRIGDDQYEFNKFMNTHSKKNSIDRDFLSRQTTCSRYRDVELYILSPVFFAVSAGARQPARDSLANMFSIVPYLVHFTDSGDALGKLGTMRNYSAWLVDECEF